jgi:hypothetical protein
MFTIKAHTSLPRPADRRRPDHSVAMQQRQLDRRARARAQLRNYRRTVGAVGTAHEHRRCQARSAPPEGEGGQSRMTPTSAALANG